MLNERSSRSSHIDCFHRAAKLKLSLHFLRFYTPPDISCVCRMLPAPLMTYQYQRSFIKAASESFYASFLPLRCSVCGQNIANSYSKLPWIIKDRLLWMRGLHGVCRFSNPCVGKSLSNLWFAFDWSWNPFEPFTVVRTVYWSIKNGFEYTNSFCNT